MKLWLISQDERDGYGTYDSAVVCAETQEQARLIHPSGFAREVSAWPSDPEWASSPEKVSAELIGEAASEQQAGVVLTSFNAG